MIAYFSTGRLKIAENTPLFNIADQLTGPPAPVAEMLAEEFSDLPSSPSAID
jgi:hypothetical protein